MQYQVDKERWSNMTIFEQMGNIYSEVGRSFSAKRRGDEEGCKQAMIRAIDLFDSTAESLVAKKSPKLKEVLRAKETYLDYLVGDNFKQPDDSFDGYYIKFAIAARLNN